MQDREEQRKKKIHTQNVAQSEVQKEKGEGVEGDRKKEKERVEE